MKKIGLAILNISILLFQVPSLFADERLISFGSPAPIGISKKNGLKGVHTVAQ
jgi:hypothetical protein